MNVADRADHTRWVVAGPGTAVPAPRPDRHCYGYFVPDREAQRQLAGLGFDLTAPKRSFDPGQPPLPAVGTCFGGAHVSVLRRCKFSPGCLDQLRAAAACTQRWRAPAMALSMVGHQATVSFSCSVLAAAARAAAEAGWAAGVVEAAGYHMGLYNSTLEQKLTPECAAAMVDCLQHAGWGWVFAIDDGDPHGAFKFDWGTFIPSSPATVPALWRGTLCNALSRKFLHTRESFETLSQKWQVFQLSDQSGSVGSRWRLRPVWLGPETRRRGETTVEIETDREPAGGGGALYLHVRQSWSALISGGKQCEVLQLSSQGGADAGSRWGVVRLEDGTVALRSHRADLHLQWVAAAEKWQVLRLHWDAEDPGCKWQPTQSMVED